MINYDPWNGKQINFERTDPTGRYSPIISRYRGVFIKYAIAGAMIGNFSLAIAYLLLEGLK